MEVKLVFLLLGFLIVKLSRKHNKWDCICGEILAIGFMVIISYMLHEWYKEAWLEPVPIAKLMLLGYLPGRVVDWVFR